MATEIRHRGKCGGLIGYYLPDKPREDYLALSKDFLRLDGTHPKEGETIDEICPACNERIYGTNEMQRMF